MVGNTYRGHGRCFTLSHYVTLSVKQMKGTGSAGVLRSGHSPNSIRHRNDVEQFSSSSLTPKLAIFPYLNS